MSENDQQIGLFAPPYPAKNASSHESPLAHRLRPAGLDQFVGLDKLQKRYHFLKPDVPLPSLVLWGPPGSGKTTLARLLTNGRQLELHHFNAVLGGIPELKKLIKDVRAKSTGPFALFIDEIHRFNKAQQDALLPFVEEGQLILIGATTENPRSALNKALLSRVQLVELASHSEQDLQRILERALTLLKLELDSSLLSLMIYHAQGDARRALAHLELVTHLSQEERTEKNIKRILLKNDRSYDKNGDRHYNVISAFIKSLRGSDPDAALLYLAVMLDGGEDPVFIARRLVIFASEDIGNADPQALTLAVSTMQAVAAIGMPEARINLGHAVCYLAATTKSNACYMAINKAMEFVQQETTTFVPDHLKNFPPKQAQSYLYPHSYPDHFVEQDYTLNETPLFYKPGTQGVEDKIRHRLNGLRPSRYRP